MSETKFVVSARKYRPVRFEDVVGQQSITSTLKNAILTNQLAQAFLFCGPRGVGKTTCARILAKTINCMDLQPSGEACGKCESCTSFTGGNSLNIFELDAASNNTVDDIRQLINQVRIAPTVGTKKVYIIDEVHMLSTAAFNAFLKTLEEPPEHAIFILATTEKHKILPTILSRCQIFNFNRISADFITEHLMNIAKQENLEVEQDGLHIIAQKADGGLRDALSIFDQMVSYEQGKVTYNGVIQNLNILDYDYYFEIADAILNKDVKQVLVTAHNIFQKGFDEHQFMSGLAEHFRNLLVGQDEATTALLEVGEGIRKKYIGQAEKYDIALLIDFLEAFNQFDVQYKTSKSKRLLTEITLMKFCSDNLSEVKKKSLTESN
jgi:DNA polymerase-3 subunit gamma/tau